MDDPSTTQSFPNLHHHRHRPSLHLTLPGLPSPEVGYPSPQPALDPQEQYENRGEESTNSFPTSSTCSGGRRGSSVGKRGFPNTSDSCLDRDANLGGHLDEESGFGSHFSDTWYCRNKKEDVWDDVENCESAADNLYRRGDCYSNANDVFYSVNCGSEEEVRPKLRASYNNYTHAGWEDKADAVYNREANVSHFVKQATPYARTAAGSFSDSSVDYSRVSDNYVGREEDYGSSCGSGEDQLQPAEVEGPWVSASPSSQPGEGRWRGPADTLGFASGGLPQRSPLGVNGGTYTQKLDSFSEAFLSQRKRRFPLIPGGDASGQIWEFGGGRGESPGLVNSGHGCAFDPDSYLLPSSSSSPPAHPSHLSFPSPPMSSHIMPSVLSPPPTPLPPPSHSPSKVDSPIAFGGTGHSVSQGGESLGPLQFFTSHLTSLSSVHSPGMLWKFPPLTHGFSQSLCEPHMMEGNLRPSHGSDYGNITAPHIQSPEAAFLSSTSHPSSLNPSRALSSSSTPSIHPSFHLPSRPSHIPSQHYEANKITSHMVTQNVKNGQTNLNQSQMQQKAATIYTGTPFPSILHSGRGQERGRYTPQPLLNPVRRGTGLYSSISSLNHREEVTTCGEEENECVVLPYVNVGHDFQAELPPCFVDVEGSRVWSEEESPREQLLWKPWDKLEEATNQQDQVELLLSMCSSSCMPGGGSNTELTLHCLHSCQGNTMDTLEMLLLSQPSPTGDYHYSGSDCWTDSEKSLFSATLGTYGKAFSLIQKTVRTKTVCQCVEFYYLSKKLQDKQKKQKEEENRDALMEQQKNATPIFQPMERQFGLEEAVPAPSLASYFPCKLCGKMFYKIKSRNAHMKIHRQPQEDWTERRLQHQLLTQRMALSRPTNLMPSPDSNLLPTKAAALTFPSSGLAGRSSNNKNADNVLNIVTNNNAILPSHASVLEPSDGLTYSNISASNSRVITNIDGCDSNQREPTAVLPLHQPWGSYGHGPAPTIFYCNTEGKDTVGIGTVGGKEPINWQ
ncbi:transcriptional-regulating factor 1-like [Clinocottus analis]|uniref:transcriptional-regulating factor 1-like n=1 Tax=Clinocottus analis TaxID=304258 RepID=UPI0035C191F2